MLNIRPFLYFSVKYYFIMWKNIFYFSVFILIITACSKEHTPRPDDNDPDDFTEKNMKSSVLILMESQYL